MSEQTLKADRPPALAVDATKTLSPAKRISDSVLPAVLLVGVTIAAVCAMFWTHALGSSSCHIRLAPYIFGVTSAVSATVPAGVPCMITIRPGSASIDALTIESHPKVGTLSARGRTGVIYRPNSRTGGPDEFAFAVHGVAPSLTQKFVIRVSTDAK